MHTVEASGYRVEPIYFTTRSGKLISGETIAEVTEDEKPEVDLCALREYFTFQNIVSERTLFKGVHKLHNLPWNVDFYPTTQSYEDCVERLRVLLRDVMQRYTQGNKTGGLLSGGTDGSTIAAFAPKSYPTFTVGFKGYEEFDESTLATVTASHLGLQNHQTLLGPEALRESLEDLTLALEEPRLSISYPDYYAYKLAAWNGIKTLLTGTGGDEMFAGYPWKYEATPEQYLAAVQRLVPEREHSEFFSEYVMKETRGFSPLEEFTSRHSYQTIYDRFNTDLQPGLSGQLILNDKLARHFGLEVKAPFLDSEITEFALRLPTEYKYHNGTTKRILRDAMKGILPDSLLERPKQGFYPPDEHWYRKENAAFVRSKLDALSKTYFFKPQYLDRVFMEHLNGANNTRLLWSLMSFESWLRVNSIA